MSRSDDVKTLLRVVERVAPCLRTLLTGGGELSYRVRVDAVLALHAAIELLDVDHPEQAPDTGETG